MKASGAGVIEFPAPRRTAYDHKRFDVRMPDNLPVTERACTSPVRYTP